jgi:hypothetical protein
LTVTDADGFEHSDTVTTDVNDVLVPPTADAGPDQNVAAGRTVTLNGSNSSDPDGTVTDVLWEQLAGGNQVTLSTPNALTSEFRAPDVDANGDVLTFKLTITDDDNLTTSDTVTVTVAMPLAPSADAGPDQIATEGETVTLNGSGSIDPDGVITSVQWEQVSGQNQVTLATPGELTTEFSAPAAGINGDTLTFKLTIRDNDDLVSSDFVDVSIRSAAVSASQQNGGGSGGGCFIRTAWRRN